MSVPLIPKKELKYHKFSNTLRLIEGSKFEALKKDILENGQRNKITIYNGEILDGRNRYRACNELGIVPKTEEFHGTEVEAAKFVISQNLSRRHMNPGQVAIAHLVIYDLLKEANALDQKNRKRGTLGNLDHPQLAKNKTAYILSKQAGIGQSTILEAVMLRNKSPETLQKVVDGEITLSKAYASLPKVKYGKYGKKLDYFDRAASEFLKQQDLNEPFEIPKDFDTYEKIMHFAIKVSGMGYMIQTIWAHRKVYVQIVKESSNFNTWRSGRCENDFRRAFCVESSTVLKQLVTKVEKVA